MKPDVFDTILRPALSDQQGTCLFIGTPEGRNHFYDLYIQGADEAWDDWYSYHYTSYDNPFVAREEIDHARRTLPNWAFQQEYMASFDAQGSEHIDVDRIPWYEDRPDGQGEWYIAIDLAGFEQEGKRKKGKRDNSAIACVYVDTEGDWWVQEIIHGRWTLDETVNQIFKAVDKYRPTTVGIEKGIAQQAVMSPLQDIMRRQSRVFRIELLTHGNQKKTDRILWALAGRFENDKIHLRRDESWNLTFLDEASNFPNPLVHDDCLDALAYIDQIAQTVYYDDWDVPGDWEPTDAIAGY
jgi:predicted phage terminase large subunit-like protein